MINIPNFVSVMYKKYTKLVLFFIIAALVLGLFFSYSYNSHYEELGLFPTNIPSYFYPVYYSLADYDTFCKNNSLPEDFIFYHQISSLGEFFSYQSSLENAYSLTLGDYYELIDKTGMQFQLSIYLPNVKNLLAFVKYPSRKLDTNSIFRLNSKLPDPGNMREFPGGLKHPVCFVRTEDNIWYVYGNGSLYSVTWKYNGKLFSVGGSFDWSSYPNTVDDTFMAKLLNAKTAEQTIAELMCACYPDQEYTGLERIVNTHGDPRVFNEIEKFLGKSYWKIAEFFKSEA